jgi:putative FmdB family regulatory protein
MWGSLTFPERHIYCKIENSIYSARFNYFIEMKGAAMPIYEFRCLKCGKVFELLKLKKEEGVKMKCPKCKSPEVERILSTINIGASVSGSKATSTVKSCSSGSCSTIEVPGPSRR